MIQQIIDHLPPNPPAVPKAPAGLGLEGFVGKVEFAVSKLNDVMFIDGFWRGAVTASVVLCVAAIFYLWRRDK